MGSGSMNRLLVGAVAVLLAQSSAQAAEFVRVQPEHSVIAFSYEQMGVKMDGKFRKFNASLRFDPARPAAATATLDVDLGSIDLGSGEAEQEVAGKPWFDIKGFPVAHFATTAVKAVGGNRYEVAGRLTIKGVTRDLVAPAVFTSQGGGGVFEGGFALRRADFRIGEGSWAKFDIVANDVQVKFRIATSSK